MKARFWTVLLLALAVAFGWFCPAVICAISQSRLEAQVRTTQTEQVSLSYDVDLEPLGKLEAVAGGTLYYGIGLEQGVFSRQQDIVASVEAFLQDAAEDSFSVSRVDAQPLMRTDGRRRSIVVWQVWVELQTRLAEPMQVEFTVDDATGMVLSFQWELGAAWDISAALWPSACRQNDTPQAIARQLLDAYNLHLQRQLPAGHGLTAIADDIYLDELHYSAEVTVSDADGQSCVFVMELALDYAMVDFNPSGWEWLAEADESFLTPEAAGS